MTLTLHCKLQKKFESNAQCKLEKAKQKCHTLAAACWHTCCVSSFSRQPKLRHLMYNLRREGCFVAVTTQEVGLYHSPPKKILYIDTVEISLSRHTNEEADLKYDSPLAKNIPPSLSLFHPQPHTHTDKRAAGPPLQMCRRVAVRQQPPLQ